MQEKIRFADLGEKFDLQLSQAHVNERRLAEIFAAGDIHLIELKSETWQWEQTGNICIEFARDGEPTGIAVTEAGYWVHELKRDDATLCYLMFPIDRLRALARAAYAAGRVRHGAGDGGRQSVVLVRLADILK